jgi:hypothetical protein
MGDNCAALIRPSCPPVSVISGPAPYSKYPTLVVPRRLMSLSPRRRKRDPLNMLILAVVIGMAVTLFYQVQVYYGADRIPFVRQAPVDRVFGG